MVPLPRKLGLFESNIQYSPVKFSDKDFVPIFLIVRLVQDPVGTVKPASHRSSGCELDRPSRILGGVIKQSNVLFCHDLGNP